MEKTEMIDWQSEQTHVLINPRMPPEKRERLEGFAAATPLPGHVWLATSGTTGLKLCALSKRAMLASAKAVNQHLRTGREDRWCCVLPTFHVGGLGIYARASLHGNEVIAAKWDPEEFVRLCEERRVTLSSLVPTQVVDLVRKRLRSPASVRAIVVGGGAMAQQIYRQARQLGWKLLPSYGMTECASQIATMPLELLREEDGAPRLELLPHLRGRREADGRLAFSGESLLTGYGTESGFVDPKVRGWFITDDYGSLETLAGRQILSVSGRGTDFVKIGGESTNLRRLEQILHKIAPEADATVVAIPDDRLGHVIALAVTPECDAPEALIASFNDRVLPFERIRATHVVEQIPRSPLGKVLTTELLAMLK